MNTKIVMTSSAVMLGISGIVLTFIPDEIISILSLETNKTLIFLLQIIGSLYFAFGMLNWMSKTSLIGGIYNRPISIANFSHFFIAGLALVKIFASNINLPAFVWITGIIYIIFAVLFGLILFRHPNSHTK